REAHDRGIRVVTELVVNHTSDEHPWFQKSRRAKPGSPWRDYYVWSDTPEKYKDARIIFKDFETSNWSWDPVAHAYYWHRFYAHQPDLNYESSQVQRAIFQVLDLWFGQGVDGLRLDAVPYLYELDGTSCESLPETLAFLTALLRPAALHRGTVLDKLAGLLAVGGIAMPGFWLGIVLIYVFSVQLGWLPSARMGGPEHYVLPTITLGAFLVAGFMRLMRSSML